MASLSGFDATTVPEMADFSVLPEAPYVSVAIASEMKPTRKGDGEYLNVTCEVIDGQYKGRKFWARMNIKNPNPVAVQIGHQELGALCRAVGVIKPNDSSELHNRPFIAHLGIELNDQKKEQNIVKKYEPVGAPGQAPAPVPAPAYQAAPPAQAPAYQAPAPDAAPAAAGTAPWHR